MPVIPSFTSREEYPGRQPGIQVPTSGAEEIANTGRRLGAQIQNIGVQFNNDLAEARRTSDLARYDIETARALETLQLQLERDPDYRQAPNKFRAATEELYKKYTDEIQDPVVLRLFTSNFKRLAITKEFAVRRSAFARESDSERASLDENIDTYGELIANARTEPEAAAIRSMARQRIQGAALSGWIHEEDAVKLEKRLLSRADEVRVRRDILTNPENTYVSLIDPEKYKSLDPKTRVELTDMANRRMVSERERINREADQAERRAEKLLQRNQSLKEVELLDQLDKDPSSVTAEQLGELARRQQISESGYHFLRDARMRVEDGKTDFPVMAGILDDIRNRDPNVLDRIYNASAMKKLSNSDAVALIRAYDSSRKENFDSSDQSFYLTSLRRYMGAEGFNISLEKDDAARISRAEVEYYERVRKGEKPQQVYEELTRRYSTLIQNQQTIPTPRFFNKRPESAAEARQMGETLRNMRNDGTVKQSDYEREVKVLEDWFNLYNRREQAAPPPPPTSGQGPRIAPQNR